MAGLGGIVSFLVKNSVKSAIKFELAIDPIIARFESQCPPKNELDKILQQKNQLSQAITQIETSLTSLSSTGSTIDSIVTGVKAGVTLIKALPVPSSVPPGVGIPLNVINGFSDTLDTLGILLKEFGGVTSQIAPSLQIITGTLSTVNVKLSTLDGLLAGCLQSETEGMTDLEKEEFFQSLGIDLSSPDNTGGSNNPNNGAEDENTDVNETLESRLSPNSNNPIVYKGFTITLDNDAGNQFSFPSRRAIGVNGEGVKIVTPFSFSSSTQVLIDAIKFQIDQTGSIELARLARESKIEQLKIQEEELAAQARYNASKRTADVLYFLYIEESERFKSSSPIRRNEKILIKKYNDVIEFYKNLLTTIGTIPVTSRKQETLYIEKRIQELEKTQNQILKSYIINTSQSTQTSGGISGMVSSTSSSLSYPPFNGPGTINGEVRFKGGKYFRYLSQPKKWVDHTPSFAPFTTKGMPGQTKVLERSGSDSDGPFKIKDTYEWNNLLYIWVFKSTETLGNL